MGRVRGMMLIGQNLKLSGGEYTVTSCDGCGKRMVLVPYERLKSGDLPLMRGIGVYPGQQEGSEKICVLCRGGRVADWFRRPETREDAYDDSLFFPGGWSAPFQG